MTEGGLLISMERTPGLLSLVGSILLFSRPLYSANSGGRQRLLRESLLGRRAIMQESIPEWAMQFHFEKFLKEAPTISYHAKTL